MPEEEEEEKEELYTLQPANKSDCIGHSGAMMHQEVRGAPADPQQEPFRMSQHAVMEPSQGCRVGHLIEVVLQQLDEEASQHSCFWCDIRLWACEHHVDDGLGGVEASVSSVP